MEQKNVEIEFDYDNIILPKFRHLVEDNDIDIELLWGGRDSGKSKFVAQIFAIEQMKLDYFRGLLIKQTHESIKDSQWQMIKDTVEQWNVDWLFKFQSSPLLIKCMNKNTCSARGMDNPAKIRSFSNPSHAWIEEANQTTEESFINVLTGLRNDYGKVKLYMTFNPEAKGDFEQFWLYRMFFAGRKEKNFIGEIVIKIMVDGREEEVRLKYRSTHATYQDNPYVDNQRKAFHESLKETNYYFYRVFTLGEWGNEENKSPWLYAWDKQKHVAKQELYAEKNHELYITFDFNRNPMTCTVLQWPDQKKIRFIETIKVPNIGTEGICEIILEKYPGYLYIVTGDYSGNNLTSLFKEQITNYTIIKKMLKLNDKQVRLKPNPSLKSNRTLVNSVFSTYPIETCPVKCKHLIYDFDNVKVRADGTIIKEDRDDPAQQADCLDGVRYWINYFMSWYAKFDVPTTPKVSYHSTTIEPSTLHKSVIVNSAAYTAKSAELDSIEAINNLSPIHVTSEEYKLIRSKLLDHVGKLVDKGDGMRASFGLEEIRRQDTLFKQLKKI